jgi:hypothetical protein
MTFQKLMISALLGAATLVAPATSLSSPDGNLKLTVDTNSNGTPLYELTYKNKTVIASSKLGLVGQEYSLLNNFEVTSVTNTTVDETWTPVWGEYSSIRNNYNELLVSFAQRDERHARLDVRFRLFNDGLGFRYELPEQDSINYLAVTDETTEFNLAGNDTLYCIPGDYDTDEYLYTIAPIESVAAPLEALRGKHSESQAIKEGTTVQTPLMIKSEDGSLYINIHEAALVDYAALLLNVNPTTHSLSAHLTPDRLGVRAYLQLPFNTPWRTIIVSDNACDILASQMILNLNEPCKIEDTSWIRPMKFVGVWWEMFTGAGKTWAYSDYYKAKPGVTDYDKLTPNGRHPANTANVKRYIDFAAKYHIPGVLVEGWNEGWEDWCGWRKNRQFLFDKPYPDFDVDGLQSYAKERGVELIMHHETAANAADYERQLETAFTFMRDHGYNAVKTGYVGAIIPRSEHHSSQWMVNHVLHVASRAADYHIMVDSHEAPRPTGLCRTYPNWLAQESARGGEFESMGGNPPEHTCILPFTRLKGGPMDYTPGLFQTRLNYYNPESTKQAMTTLARQLALYLTMPSPMQMACDLPENYERFPDAFQFIVEVPVDWSDSRYLEAEPGDYITVARKDKNSDNWYVGAITDENARTATVDLSFLPKGVKYEATIYADAADADWKDNPQAYKITSHKVTSKSRLKLQLAPGGGAAISIKPIQ